MIADETARDPKHRIQRRKGERNGLWKLVLWRVRSRVIVTLRDSTNTICICLHSHLSLSLSSLLEKGALKISYLRCSARPIRMRSEAFPSRLHASFIVKRADASARCKWHSKIAHGYERDSTRGASPDATAARSEDACGEIRGERILSVNRNGNLEIDSPRAKGFPVCFGTISWFSRYDYPKWPIGRALSRTVPRIADVSSPFFVATVECLHGDDGLALNRA
jgi:hypothetical protein